MEVAPQMLLVPPDGLRRGFAALMTAYNSQRVGAGTVALGIASGAFELAVNYVKDREQFGRPLAEFQGLQWMLADMSTSIVCSAGATLQSCRKQWRWLSIDARRRTGQNLRRRDGEQGCQ